MAESILLLSTYLGPIDYYRALAHCENAYIEQYDHFEKRSYRNHCRIMTCNKVMDLAVPIIRTKEKSATRDIKIAYTEKWQLNHWRAIESAYNNSPFFEYYKEDYEPFFTKRFDYLIDFNQGLLQTTLDLIHLRPNLHFTDEYITKDECKKDLRSSFHPRIESPIIQPYYQVFDQKFGFQPNLSIIDLLFNLGPEALLYLQ